MARRARDLLATVAAAAVAALLLPALALAQQSGPGPQQPAGPEIRGGGRGGLPMTGFETWEVAALGAALLVAGLLLVRRTREVRA